MKQSTFPSLPVLLVDDEEQFLLSASVALSADGINNIVQCQDSRDIMPLLSKQDFSVIILDMKMPHVPGWELLPEIVQDFPGIPVIIVTAMDDVETAVDCMKKGASDYIVKAVDTDRLVNTVRLAIEMREVLNENALLKQYLLSDKLEHPEAFSAIVTRSDAMRSIFQYVEVIARTSMPVLITGETGVGKELIARAIHHLFSSLIRCYGSEGGERGETCFPARREGEPFLRTSENGMPLSGRRSEFVPVNIAGVDDTLFSDTLFGHKRGAFTSAEKERKGLIEQASGGTLFLDEIADLGFESQVKLLRLLQEGKYYPIGSDVPKLSDARIIVATNRDIASMQERGEFRKDLFYRLRTHHVHIPPLRERREDIPLLIEHFLQKAAEALGKKKPTPPKELSTLLGTYHFPGNIRELESMIFDAVSRHKSGVLSMESLKEKMTPEQSTYQTMPGTKSDKARRLRLTERGEAVLQTEETQTEDKQILFLEQLPTLKEAEEILISEALKRADGNQTIAAQLLGLSRRALNNRLMRVNK